LELLHGVVLLVAGAGAHRAQAALEEGVAPTREHRAGPARLPGRKVKIFGSQEAKDRITLAFGREPAAFWDGQAGGPTTARLVSRETLVHPNVSGWNDFDFTPLRAYFTAG
jgi:hypothetical protein